jgi:hypothetical protein
MRTKTDIYELSQAQLTAVDLLATGSTMVNAAEAVSVTRQTVSVWCNNDAEFKAALNRRRQELWNEQSDRLRSLLPKALDVVEAFLEAGAEPSDRLRAATTVLRIAGVAPSQIGEVKAGRIRREDYLSSLISDEAPLV